MSTLNNEQLKATTQTQGPLLILAGAGTGKTKTITHRIAHMIEGGIAPEAIVAVTFTNKAANEMRERVAALISERAASLVNLSTFHSFCLKLLRRYHSHINRTRGFAILDTGDQVDLMRKALRELHLEKIISPYQGLTQISLLKNQLVYPETVISQSRALGHSPQDALLLAKLYELYETLLGVYDGIDFDDCITKCVKLLSTNPKAHAECHEQYTHFLIDEFQDTNIAQLKLIELLASPRNNVCVVGDDDQSIYGWRGAVAHIMEEFEKIFPGTQMIKLEQNYRCPNIVLEAANTVIRNNHLRKEKALWSDNSSSQKILVHRSETDAEESHWVAEKIAALLGRGTAAKDICILYRSNQQARIFESALKSWSIKYRIFGGSSFFERKETKDVLSFLRLILNPKDHLSLWRIINTPHRGIGIKTQEKLENLSRQGKIPPLVLLQSPENLTDISASAKKAIDELVTTLTELRALPRKNPKDFEVITQEIIDRFKLRSDIISQVKDKKALEFKLQILAELPKIIHDMVNEATRGAKSELSVLELLDIFTLGGYDETKEDKSTDSVSLMTLHSAKGLEFKVVFIVGVEEELLPHKNSMDSPQSLAEERRLFYVGLTRAKSQVFICHCRKRQTQGIDYVYKKPSRFIMELPDNTVLKGAEGIDSENALEDINPKSRLLSKLSRFRDEIKP